MLNIGIGELLLLMALLLVFVGPERLPGLLRWAGHHYGKLRRAAFELQHAFMDEADMAEAQRKGYAAKPPLAKPPLAEPELFPDEPQEPDPEPVERVTTRPGALAQKPAARPVERDEPAGEE